MALYGPNLAKTVRPGTTWQQATDLLGVLEDAIRECYSNLSLWENWKQNGIVDTINLAVLSAIVPDDARAMKPALDDQLAGLYSFDTIVQEQGGSIGWNAPIADDFLAVLQSKVDSSSRVIELCDSLFHTSVASQVADAIVPVVGNLGDQVGNALSKLIGNFLAGIWWIIALGLGLLWLWHKWGHKAVT